MFSQTLPSRLPTSQARRVGFREDEGERVSGSASRTGESKRLCSGRTERLAEAGRGAPDAGPTWEPAGHKKPVEGRPGSGARTAAVAARRPEPGRPRVPRRGPGERGRQRWAGPGGWRGGARAGPGIARGPSRLRPPPPAAPPGAAASRGPDAGPGGRRAACRGPGARDRGGDSLKGAAFAPRSRFTLLVPLSLLSALLTWDGQQSHRLRRAARRPPVSVRCGKMAAAQPEGCFTRETRAPQPARSRSAAEGGDGET